MTSCSASGYPRSTGSMQDCGRPLPTSAGQIPHARWVRGINSHAKREVVQTTTYPHTRVQGTPIARAGRVPSPVAPSTAGDLAFGSIRRLLRRGARIHELLGRSPGPPCRGDPDGAAHRAVVRPAAGCRRRRRSRPRHPSSGGAGSCARCLAGQARGPRKAERPTTPGGHARPGPAPGPHRFVARAPRITRPSEPTAERPNGRLTWFPSMDRDELALEPRRRQWDNPCTRENGRPRGPRQALGAARATPTIRLVDCHVCVSPRVTGVDPR